MALNIKHPEAHRLARELAEVTGQSMAQAVTQALRDAMAKEKRRPEPLLAQLEAIADHCAALPVLDDRPAEDILGYDERGMPSS